MIGSSHATDKKVRRLAVLNQKTKTLKTVLIEYQISLIKKTRFSSITEQLKREGFLFSKYPPEILFFNSDLD